MFRNSAKNVVSDISVKCLEVFSLSSAWMAEALPSQLKVNVSDIYFT